MDKEASEQNWFRRHWIISIFLGLMVLGIIGSMFGENDNQSNSNLTGNVINENSNNNAIKLGDNSPQATTTPIQTANKPEYDLEMTTEQIFNEFDGLSDIQTEEKIKEFKDKRIKTSLYVSKIDKASLSSQYVAMEMYEYPYNLMPYVKAFFPAEEKDNLLETNIGDTIVFSGEFVAYKKGGLTDYIEFTKSKVIEIKPINY